ncbi:MAG: GumC family protein [Devosia sp.]
MARRDLPPAKPAGKPAPPPVAARRPLVWPALTADALLGWVLGGLKLIIALALVGAAVGYGYSLVVEPKYTAATDLIIDPGNLQVVTNDLYQKSFDQNAQILDVESRLRVVTSGNVLTRVVQTLGLDKDPEFINPPGMFGIPALSFGSDAADESPVLTAVDALQKRVGAWREERSFVVTVAVSTSSPDKSVAIANAIVGAFQAELARQEADGAGRTVTALTKRLAAMQDDVQAAELAVQSFRQVHNLQESDGQLVNSQSMTQINKNELDAQQALIAAQARFDAVTNSKTGKANSEAVQTDTMVALRTKYSELKQAADAAATMYGPLHPNRTSAERQLSGIQQQIDAEAARAVQNAKLDLDQAKRAAAQFADATTAARTTVSLDDTATIELNGLIRDAKSKSDVYDAFLTRAREVTEQQQLDTTNIKVISPATPPSVRSWPPRGVVVAGMGGAMGAGLAVALVLALGFLGALRRENKATR